MVKVEVNPADESLRPYVAVVGPAECDPETYDLALAVGRLLAEAGAVVVCGGLGGVMEAAARGAASAGGTSVGILPGNDRSRANRDLTVAVATGLGELRNGLVVRASDAVVAVGWSWGTLSEIALAARIGLAVVCLRGWPVADIPAGAEAGAVIAPSPEAAVQAALAGASARRPAPE